MNRFLLTCLAAWPRLAALSLRANAQTTVPLNAATPPATQVPQRISYRRDVPASVLKLMPRGAKSRFYGTFRLKASGPEYALHLYAPERNSLSRNDSSERFYDLSIFQRDAFKTKRVNHIRVAFAPAWDAPPSKMQFAVDRLWLNPLRQMQPILKIVIDLPGYGGGRLGDVVLAVFPNGLAGKTVRQSFSFGDTNADSKTLDFSTLSTFHTLQVKETSYSPNFIYRTVYRWNGKRFVASSSVESSLDAHRVQR